MLRGSMISSTQNVSALRNGERSLLSRSSISLGLGVGGGVDLGAVGRHDPAFERQRPPVPRRPGIAQRKPIGRQMTAPATPNKFRTMKVHHGTVDWLTAAIARTPFRIVAAFSASTPI